MVNEFSKIFAGPVAVLLLVVLLLAGSGCEDISLYGRRGDAAGEGWPRFEPREIKLQPSFTRFRHEAGAEPQRWLDAYVTVLDNFGNPMKALGKFRFEIFYYRSQEADPRGPRFVQDGLQEFELVGLEANQGHWNEITRSYKFKLMLPEAAYELNDVVVELTLEPENGSRLGDFLIVHRGS